MKIAYFIDSMKAGGKERQLSYLLSAISQVNDVQMYIFDEDVFYDEIYKFPIEIIKIKKEDRYKLKTLRKLHSKLRKFKPEIIHTWDNISQILISGYTKTHKVKIINGSIRYGGSANSSLKNRLIKQYCFKTADLIVANSKQGLEVEGLKLSKRVKVIYNGLDQLNKTSFSFEKDDYLPTTINKFSLNVVMVGRFQAAKDYSSFIKLAKKIVATNKLIAFHCIGEGSNRSSTEKEAEILINENIFFWGRRNDIRNILKLFDIGVLLNNTNGHAEGISNAIMEYMQSGLPVIATNAGGTPELIKNIENGFLVPAFDIEEIEKSMLSLLSNEALRHEMGINNIKKISTMFTIEQMIENYKNLYKIK